MSNVQKPNGWGKSGSVMEGMSQFVEPAVTSMASGGAGKQSQQAGFEFDRR